eukprot:GEZU01021225.1.p3 GENE.GEZU01021225.1~~GEZU01021225.1.p3  ORF type:complete len:113 (+),score=46.57 GEZU01021225.1:495-833(+)
MKEVKERVTLLLRYGANTNIKNLEKETPLDIAKRIDALIVDVQSWKEKKPTTAAEVSKGKRATKTSAAAAADNDDNNKGSASASAATTTTNGGEDEYYATYPFKEGLLGALA